MVNKIVLEYLRVNRGNYNLGALKKKILSSGHTQKDIDDALVQLDLDSKKNVPSVSATINKINKTNIVEEKPVAIAGNVQKNSAINMPVPKKSKKWLWIIIIISLLVLIGVGFSVWHFLLK